MCWVAASWTVSTIRRRQRPQTTDFVTVQTRPDDRETIEWCGCRQHRDVAVTCVSISLSRSVVYSRKRIGPVGPTHAGHQTAREYISVQFVDPLLTYCKRPPRYDRNNDIVRHLKTTYKHHVGDCVKCSGQVEQCAYAFVKLQSERAS